MATHPAGIGFASLVERLHELLPSESENNYQDLYGEITRMAPITPRPVRALRTILSFGRVHAFFVGAADDAVCDYG